MTLIQQITTEANIASAWQKVRTNMGAPGVDRVSVEEYENNLHENLALLRNCVSDGTYTPLPYLSFTQKKESGKERNLNILSVRDRVAQQAIHQVLVPIYEKIFHNCSYAYRPGKSTFKAIERLERNLHKGRTWIFDGDIECFFDRVDRALLLQILAETITEQPVLKLIELCIQVQDSDDGKGIAQGMVLAPLLSNIYLHKMDDRMFRFQWNYIRYSDNILVVDFTEARVKEARELAEQCLAELQLLFNPEKTAICQLSQGFTFLGFYFDEHGKRPGEQAVLRLNRKVESVMQKAYEYSEAQLKEKIESIVRGWLNYFKLEGTDRKQLLDQLEEKFAGQEDSMPQRILKAALAYQLGDRSRAQATLQKTPVVDSNDAEINLQWGLLCDKLGMKNEALDSYLNAYRLNSEHPEVAYRLGLYYLESQNGDLAVRYCQKAVDLNPKSAAAHLTLGNALKLSSMDGSAQFSFARAIQLDPSLKKIFDKVETPAITRTQKVPYPFTDADIGYFLNLFSGREGVFSQQWVNNKGKTGYNAIRNAMTERDIRTHFQGDQTLGYYLVRSDNTVSQLVFDIDVTKQVRMEILTSDDQIPEWKNLVWSEVLRITRALANHGIKSYAEDSGFKGMHVWVFFIEPQPAKDAILLARKVLATVGEPAPGLNREVFPREAHVASQALGPMIKLPLGIHKLTNRRCLFLDSTGEPFPDQLAIVRNVEALSTNTFKKILEQLKSSPSDQLNQEPKADRTQVDKVIKGCNVLRYLINKAESQKMLSHIDRLTILGILGHLDKAGRQVIHEIIGHTLNYSFGITDRWIRRQKGFPVSCPKIREWQKHITPGVGCYCKFKDLSNSYPAPVLHADPEFVVKVRNQQQQMAKQQPVPVAQSETEKQEPAAVLAASLSEPVPVAAQPEPVPASIPAAIVPGVPATTEINKILRDYLEVRKSQRQTQHKIATMEQQMNQLCDQRHVDQFDTEFGSFRRVKTGSGSSWMIEI